MTITGVSETVLGQVEYAWIAKKNGNYPYGITGTLANGSDAGMRRARGFTTLTETLPTGTVTPVVGDGTVISSFRSAPTDVATADFAMVVFDQVMAAALDGRTIYTEGQWDISLRTQKCKTLSNMFCIVNGRAKSQEAGTVNNPGWYSILYYDVEGEEVGRGLSGTAPDAVPSSYSLSLNEVDTLPTGEDPDTNYRQSRTLASDPIIADYPLTLHTFIGDAATVVFTLDETPSAASSNAVAIWKDGVKLDYTTDYTLVPSTGVVTLVAAPAAGSVVIALYEFVPSCS